jgi:hypothetical protein
VARRSMLYFLFGLHAEKRRPIAAVNLNFHFIDFVGQQGGQVTVNSVGYQECRFVPL